jgi:hypothetical protein
VTNLLFLTLLALIPLSLGLACYTAARRERAQHKARLVAAIKRRKGEAWQRLARSAAGAP